MTRELHRFQYYLEDNLWRLFCDLCDGRYRHGSYRHVVISDNKRRDIAIASIRDRVVHRLIYDYLVAHYDNHFLYDVWSCREGKGVVGAIDRTQKFLTAHRADVVWRADITKFFDNVDQGVLMSVLTRRIGDKKTLQLLQTVIASYQSKQTTRERERVNPRRGAYPLAT